jgi:hypothetical protein
MSPSAQRNVAIVIALDLVIVVAMILAHAPGLL